MAIKVTGELTVISPRKAKNLIEKSKGKIFYSEHLSKSDGVTIVKMTCRIGVKKGVTGKGLGYDPAEYDLIPVYSCGRLGYSKSSEVGYKFIWWKGLQRLHINGNLYQVR